MKCSFFHPDPFRSYKCRTCGMDLPFHKGEMKLALQDQELAVEQMIALTPTGENRNHLTDVNIHLKAALAALALVTLSGCARLNEVWSEFKECAPLNCVGYGISQAEVNHDPDFLIWRMRPSRTGSVDSSRTRAQ